MISNPTDMPLLDRYKQLKASYKKQVLETSLESNSPELQAIVRALIRDAESLWKEFLGSGAFSRATDELKDIPANVLEFLVLPHLQGDLWQRVQRPEEGSDQNLSQVRAEALNRSNNAFGQYLELAVDLEITTKKDIETMKNPDRTTRIKLNQQQSALRKELSEKEKDLEYRIARLHRLRRIRQEEGDEILGEEGDDGEDEMRREVADLRLRWCAGDAMHQMNLNSRELEIVGGLSEEAKRKISENYQANIELWKSRKNPGRQTYTVLPGGFIAPGAPLSSNAVFREKVKAEMFMQRNLPTMTLEEFAQLEMKEIERQQQRAKELAEARAEEDARLGEEGIEERERQQQAAKDDWRDDHPAHGLSNKGNYS